VIPAIHKRGTRVGGLLRYLYGPGKREEHINPHIVAAWDGAGDLADLEPAITPPDQRDFRHLTELLEIPVRAGRNPPHRYVWHCSLRGHPTDRALTDDHWSHIAREVVAGVGLAPPGDEDAVRWIAVRHADDHVHLVATLVRQDRRTCWARNDYQLAQAACRDIEQRYGLYRVGAPGQGTRRWPKPAELNKAARQGRTVAPREELRRRVRAAGTIAVDENDFLDRLRSDGIEIRLRQSYRDSDLITGYAVALPGHTTASGDLIFHSGGKLAADLSLPRLRTRWNPDTSLSGARRGAARLNPAFAEVYATATAIVAEATAQLHSGARDADGVAAGAADLLAAMAAAWEQHAVGPLTKAAELLDRAAHARAGPSTAPRGSAGYGLRATARLVTLLGPARTDRDLDQALALIAAIARLAGTLADLHQALQRLHQADAARIAATMLRTVELRTAQTPPIRTTSHAVGTHARPLGRRRSR
jgi:hypothetical protein